MQDSATPSRLARVSTPENEKHSSSSEHHRVDGVLQIALENNVECCDGGKTSLVYGTDMSAQQSQRGSGNEEALIGEEQGERGVSSSLDGAKRASAGRKQQQHWKSQSVGESVVQQQQQLTHANSLSSSTTTTTMIATMTTTTAPLDDDMQQQETTTTNFSANRELWQRRATSLNPPVPPTPKSFRTSQEFREMRQKHTPDLVMDLPLSAQDASKKSASSSSLSSSDDETPTSLPVAPARAEAATSPTGGPESPDMSTAAERFAKQNQCTLKKNTKTNSEGKLKRLETADHEIGAPDAETDEIVRSASSNQIATDGGGGGGVVPLKSPLPPRSTPKIVAKFADMHLTGGSQVVSSFKPQVKVKPTILRKPVLPFPHPHMSPELARKIEKQAQSAEQAN